MISHDLRCIFIHIPKTAGTSIEAALGHFSEYTGHGRQDHRTIRQIAPIGPGALLRLNRAMMKEFVHRRWQAQRDTPNPKNAFRVCGDEFRRYFKFTFVRNPWSRLVSWYEAVRRDDVRMKELGIDDSDDFGEVTRRCAGTGQLRSQLEWIIDFWGAIGVDKVYRFERLNDDFRDACARLGISCSLPHELKGREVDYRDYYDAKLADHIRSVYTREIEAFDYEF